VSLRFRPISDDHHVRDFCRVAVDARDRNRIGTATPTGLLDGRALSLSQNADVVHHAGNSIYILIVLVTGFAQRKTNKRQAIIRRAATE